MSSLASRSLAEFIGTFTLLAAGIGSIIATDGTDNLLAVAVAHGLAIAVMVCALGHVSGAHFNPAVTFAFLATKRIPVVDAIAYWAAQLLGAVVGTLMIKGMWGKDAFDGVSGGIPALGANTSLMQGSVAEGVTTFLLVWVVFAVAVDTEGSFKLVAGLPIGFTILLDILMIGPLTGAAMNPARWFGPAVVTTSWSDAWVWIIGPIVGAVIAGVMYHWMLSQRTATQEA